MRALLAWAMLLALTGCASTYRISGDRLLPPHTRHIELRKRNYSYFGVQLNTGAPCVGKEPGVTLEFSRRSYGFAEFWLDEPSSPTVDHDMELERKIRNVMTKCSIGQFAGWVQRFLPTTLATEKRIVRLAPGMRIRFERGGGTDGSAFYGVGTVYVDVVGDKDGIFFDGFTRTAALTAPDMTGGAGQIQTFVGSAPMDINVPSAQERLPHWRLVLPGSVAPPSSKPNDVGIERLVVFAGAKTAAALDVLLDGGESLKQLQKVCNRADARCVVFRHHTYVIPEIPITLRGRATFVPVGTVLGDVVAREVDRSRVGPRELAEHFRERVELYRRFGAALAQVEVSVEDGGQWARIPLAQGDVVTW